MNYGMDLHRLQPHPALVKAVLPFAGRQGKEQTKLENVLGAKFVEMSGAPTALPPNPGVLGQSGRPLHVQQLRRRLEQGVETLCLRPC